MQVYNLFGKENIDWKPRCQHLGRDQWQWQIDIAKIWIFTTVQWFSGCRTNRNGGRDRN